MPAPILLIILSCRDSGMSHLQRILSLGFQTRKMAGLAGFEPASILYGATA